MLARTDTELRMYAVQALAKQKSARTIATYIRVLKGPAGEGPWVPVIQKALRKWTGITVRNTPTEVDAFARWWLANQKRWIEENR